MTPRLRGKRVLTVKLSLADIRKLARGCCEVREEPQGIYFDRMNEPLRDFYSGAEGFNICARCPAGVRIRFRSNTASLRASFKYGGGASQPFFGADLFVDGRRAGTFGPKEKVTRWSGEIFRAESQIEREFDLWLSYSVETWVDFLEVEDGASVEPVMPDGETWLAVGNSITQGMFCTSPSRTYAATAARVQGLALHNVGVGGGRMEPGVGKGASLIPCSIATVAFGVNDWNQLKPVDQFKRDSMELLCALLRGRENLPVGLITPLPVCDRPELNEVGASPEDLRRVLREAACEFESVTVIEGPSLVPADEKYFVDGVHPNDLGMNEMGTNLATKLKLLLGG